MMNALGFRPFRSSYLHWILVPQNGKCIGSPLYGACDYDLKMTTI